MADPPDVDRSRFVALCAARVRDAFVEYNDEFRAVTRRARTRFERRDWAGWRADAVERIELYDRRVDAAARAMDDRLGPDCRDRELWRRIKAVFARDVGDAIDAEFYKTFFSSVTRRIFRTTGVDRAIEFVDAETEPLRNTGDPVPCRSYVDQGSLPELFEAVLHDFAWSVGYEDARAGAGRVAESVARRFREDLDHETVLCVDLMEAVFYRDTRAYLVGRVTGWTRRTPLVIALANTDHGVRVDAVIQTESGVSKLFGFARSYFHVDLASVGAAILFLRQMMPTKPTDEFFTILGRAKQGKTERYRDFSRHLEHARDRFILAPGARGMVMVVFTLPSYEVVFKIIRDRFDYPKTATREHVCERYELVSKHDRGGRLVDAQEFQMLEFDRARFSPELLDVLLKDTANTVRLEGDRVVLGHVYVERRLRPLDLYLREVDRAAARRAVVDYGQAIRDLARTNIFPGDLLSKNFGISEHGRAIFYDYDELCLVTDCNFRDLPTAATHEEEMRATPWFYVADNDVFPEEFLAFLGLDAGLRQLFVEAHGDLLTAGFWRTLQARIRAGDVMEVLPY